MSKITLTSTLRIFLRYLLKIFLKDVYLFKQIQKIKTCLNAQMKKRLLMALNNVVRYNFFFSINVLRYFQVVLNERFKSIKSI